MKRLVHLNLLIIFFAIFSFGCRHNNGVRERIDSADALMCYRPDSSLNILLEIDDDMIVSEEERARYALLKSIALDKNFIDTTTFEVLQPAIDYYYHHGTPDERLRTMYYQGRIYQNRNDIENAMKLFLKAGELNGTYHDTLTYANLIVAQGSIYFMSYQIDEYITKNLLAADLYGAINKYTKQKTSYLRALDGAIINNNRHYADSILKLLNSQDTHSPLIDELLSQLMLLYSLRFECEDMVDDALADVIESCNLNDETKLLLSKCFLQSHDFDKAVSMFNMIDSGKPISSTIEYLSIKPDILESNGEYKEALEAHREYTIANEKINSQIYLKKTSVAQQFHLTEMRHMEEIQDRDRLISLGLVAVLLVTLVSLIIYYRYRITTLKRILLENESRQLKSEKDKLLQENSALEIKNCKVLQQYEEEMALSANLRLKITQLEEERDKFQKIVSEDVLPQPLVNAIQERLSMLNLMLSILISNHEADSITKSKLHDMMSDIIINDREHFMNNTRMAFMVTHPEFIKFLEAKKLDNSEINYVCLYALGLSGKQVGEYIKQKRHYHISSEIRKKLGLKENDTNLSIFIRKIRDGLSNS